MRLSVTEAANLYHIARTTIYRKVKNGELSSGSDKKIDLSEMIRVFGEPVAKTQQSVQQDNATSSVSLHQEKETLLNERIRALEDALANAERDKEWLKSQVEQSQQIIKLLEHKQVKPPAPTAKKGLFSRVVNAITNQD
jgi:transcriptional regulator of acetoin/glycerol metabolism